MKNEYEMKQAVKKWQDHWAGRSNVEVDLISDWDKVRKFAKLINWGLNDDR